MTKTKIAEQFPVVVKTLPLSESEMRTLERTFRITNQLHEYAFDLMMKALEEQTIREDEACDQMAKMFGYSSRRELGKSGMTIEADWISGSLILRSKEPPK